MVMVCRSVLQLLSAALTVLAFLTFQLPKASSKLVVYRGTNLVKQRQVCQTLYSAGSQVYLNSLNIHSIQRIPA